jgi:DNA (cytosine-5)-methyltransferase 1
LYLFLFLKTGICMFVPMKVISLFSGIGGFELAAEAVGWQPIVSCEINPFGRRVLEHYWPDAYHHDDVNTLTFDKINDELTKRFGPQWRSDDIILTGGFPCQPYSLAGKRKGKDDSRHLWPQMLRIIREVQPTWIVGENVYGLVNWNDGLVFEEVSLDLENEGYEVQPYILPAVSVGAVHRRDRVWFVAKNTLRNGCIQREFKQEGAEIWQQRNIGSRSSNGIHISERVTSNAEQQGFQRQCREWQGCTEHRNNEGIFIGSENKLIASDPDSIRLEQCENTGEMGGGQGEMGRERSEFTNAIEADGKTTNAANSDSNGCDQRNSEHEVFSDERGEYAQRDIDKSNEYGDSSNSNCEMLEHGNGERKTSGRTNEEKRTKSFDIPRDWEAFPTQSPICNGNDGIPNRLVDITIPRWRKESIMSLGNAIVPQVAIQLFKTIQQYNSITSSS